MRYTYKKKQKFYQLNTITSLNIQTSQIYENIPRFLLYSFRKSTISQTKDFLNNISRIYPAISIR